MTSNPKDTPFTTNQPFRTLRGWALGTLVDYGVVTECDHHGHRRDRADPHAWHRARDAAWNHPFPQATPEACITTMEEILRGIGDSCPDC